MGRRLGLLWDYPREDGELYLSGFLEDVSGDIPIKVTKNLRREKETHAPYVILRKDLQPTKIEEKPNEFKELI